MRRLLAIFVCVRAEFEYNKKTEQRKHLIRTALTFTKSLSNSDVINSNVWSMCHAAANCAHKRNLLTRNDLVNFWD